MHTRSWSWVKVSLPSHLAARVGKTSLTVRFCLGQFDDKQASTIDATCLEQVVSLPAPESH